MGTYVHFLSQETELFITALKRFVTCQDFKLQHIFNEVVFLPKLS